MKSKKTSISFVTLIFFLVCIALGGLLGLSILDAFGSDLVWWKLLARLLEGILLYLVALFLQVILHEAGHMIAGLLRGWSFISFMILGFVLAKKNGRFHMSRFAVPGVGGQCLMMPPKQGESDWGIAFYNAGGVLMNVLVSLITLVLSVLFYSELPWDMNVFNVSLCIVGIFFAIANGVPACHGGIPNDGMNIRELRKDPFSTQVFLTTMKVMGKLQQGYSLESVSEGYLTEGVELDYSNPIHVMAVNFDISLAIVKFDFDKAHLLFKQMESEESKIVSIYRKEMLYEKVFLFLVSPRDGVDVGDLIDPDTLNYFEMQTNFRPTSLRVKYTFAKLYEGDEVKAASIYQQFQLICKTYHIPGEVYSEKELVEYVRNLEPIDL